jgi:hypothetical protein
MKKCAVVIPVYKKTPNANELISLNRVVKVLKNYPLILFAPEGLDVSIYLNCYDNFLIERFSSNYFKDISGYNRLMMSTQFYKRFINFEYILLYQLDAYVFGDELSEWCDAGFDYIGAPWIVPPVRPADAKKPIIDFALKMVGTVGNGGFSLRKVKRHLQITRLLSPLLPFFPKNEDFFWSYIVPKLFRFKKPGLETALKFAFELAPSLAYSKNNHQLPFGCHAWEKYEPDFWKEKFKETV